MTMHNEIVSWIQSHYAADGVEVRATGPKAITLVLPQEMHDLGNFCGELEMQFNARIDIVAQTTPGLGPTATVWVAQNDGHDFNDADDDDDDDDRVVPDDKGANDNGSPTDPDKSDSEGNDPVVKQQSKWFQWAAMAVTTAAAVLTILRHGSAMMDGLPDVWQTRSDL